jgi:predicted ABC-type ATPase
MGLGFVIFLHYLWLSRRDRDCSCARGVKKGGQNVPVADVRRRFGRSLRRLVIDYAPLTDRWADWNDHHVPMAFLAESKNCPRAGLEAILEAQ